LSPVSSVRRGWQNTNRYTQLCARLRQWSDVDKLSQLCLAAIYARSAYAFIAREGLFDSVSAGAMIFSVQKAAFDMAEHDAESSAHAFQDMLGLRRDDIVDARWTVEGPFLPAYMVSRDHAMKWIVLSIRGTLSMKDILTDMAVRTVPFLDGQAHEGFVKCTMHLMDELQEVLQEQLRLHPGYKLVLCGHSMGGAVAALAAALLRQKEPLAADCVAYTIGTPGIMSRQLGERLGREGIVITIVNGNDWAPRTSISNFHLLIKELSELSMIQSAWRAIRREEAPAEEEDPYGEQLPPGQIVQIDPGSEATPRLLEAEPADYIGCMPMLPQIEAHLPIGYVQHLVLCLVEVLRRSADTNVEARSLSGMAALRRVALPPQSQDTNAEQNVRFKIPVDACRTFISKHIGQFF